LSTIFDDFLEALQDNHFEEIPVDAKTFIESPDYLGQPGMKNTQKTKSFYNLGRAVGRTSPLLLLVLILSISYYVLKTLQDISENQVEMQ